MLEQLKQTNKCIGLKQSIRLVEANLAECVFIAADSDESVVGKLREICKTKGVKVIAAESMKALGKACGIEVGAAAVALPKSN